MLPAAAQDRVSSHLAALDEVLPDRVRGYYMVGSAALGDWEQRVSNLDVVVVGATPWEAEALEVAARLHGRLAGGDEPPAVLYTTFDALAAPVVGADVVDHVASVAYTGRDRAAPGEGLDTPLTRAVLTDDAVTVRGPEWFAVADAGADALAAWAASRLEGPWRRFARRAHPPGSQWRRRPLAEALLEVCRLHVVVADGRAVSKLRAAALVLDDVPGRFRKVVDDAVGFRQGSRTSLYWGPVERKTTSVELMRLLTDRPSDAPHRPERPA